MDNNIVYLYNNTHFSKEDVRRWATQSARQSWFDNASNLFLTIETNEPVIIDKVRVVDKDFLELQQVDYLMTRKLINGKRKDFFYFVNDVEFLNETVTQLNVELDVIQTYMFDYDIKNAFIEREHQSMIKFHSSGDLRLFNKNPEPIEVAEFEYRESNLVLPYHEDFNNIYAAIVTVQKNQMGGLQRRWRYGSMEQNFKTLITFFRYNETGVYSRVGFVKDSETNRIYDLAGDDALARLSKDPNVIDIWITPYIPNVKYGGIWGGTGQPYITGFAGYTEGDDPSADYEYVTSVDVSADVSINVSGMLAIYNMPIIEDILQVENGNVSHEIDNMIVNLDGLDSKIYGSQYSSIELQFGTGTISELYADEFDDIDWGPEFKYTIGNDVEKVLMVKPVDYKTPNKFISTGSDNSLPKITDAYLEHMNNNRHSLQAKNTGNIVQSITSIGIGAAATIVSGGAAAPAAMAIAGSTLSKGVGFGMDLMRQSAQQRDLKNKPDTFNNVNSIDFNLNNNLVMAKVRIKVPTFEEKLKLHTFFNLYGYNASYYGIPEFHTRNAFNYLKLGNMTLTGPIPVEHKELIKERFAEGVRFWHDHFLNFLANNEEVV